MDKERNADQEELDFNDDDFGDDDVADEPEVEAQADDETSSPDYAALEERAAKIRPGTTLQNIVDQYAEQRSTLDRLTSEKQKLEQEYGFAKPMLEQIKTDPKYADALRRATEDYFQQDRQQPKDPAISNVLDPVTKELSQLKVEMASWRMNQQMDELARKYSDFWSDEIKMKIWDHVAQTGESDLEGVYSRIILPDLMSKAKNATKVAERMKKNSQSYQPTDGLSGEPTKESQDWTADDIEAGIEEIMRKGA